MGSPQSEHPPNGSLWELEGAACVIGAVSSVPQTPSPKMPQGGGGYSTGANAWRWACGDRRGRQGGGGGGGPAQEKIWAPGPGNVRSGRRMRRLACGFSQEKFLAPWLQLQHNTGSCTVLLSVLLPYNNATVLYCTVLCMHHTTDTGTCFYSRLQQPHASSPFDKNCLHQGANQAE
jgi:hypothetical protein